MKVLFLDHDGVICLSSQWGGRFKKKGYDSNPETPLDIRMDSFDTKAVKVLNQIIEETQIIEVNKPQEMKSEDDKQSALIIKNEDVKNINEVAKNIRKVSEELYDFNFEEDDSLYNQ